MHQAQKGRKSDAGGALVHACPAPVLLQIPIREDSGVEEGLIRVWSHHLHVGTEEPLRDVVQWHSGDGLELHLVILELLPDINDSMFI